MTKPEIIAKYCVDKVNYYILARIVPGLYIAAFFDSEQIVYPRCTFVSNDWEEICQHYCEQLFEGYEIQVRENLNDLANKKNYNRRFDDPDSDFMNDGRPPLVIDGIFGP